MKEDSLGFLCGFERGKHVRLQGISNKVGLFYTEDCDFPTGKRLHF